MTFILDNASVITAQEKKDNYSVVVSDDGKITYVGPSNGKPQINGPCYDLKGRIISPGFINVHVHGGNGVTFGHDDLESELQTYSRWAAMNGVTNFLCSIAAPKRAELTDLISRYVDILEKGIPGAECSGLHLEGPFMNVEKKGAFHPAWLRMPDVDEAKEYIAAGKGWIKQITIAPELENAPQVAEIFNSSGIAAALGHTNTDFDTASEALKNSFSHVTHTYNAQSSFSHRSPGVVGAVLSSEKVTAEIISDMVHIHPAAIKVLVRSLGTDRVVIITDAMAGAGMPDGKYKLVGYEVTVSDGIALLEDGTLAGGISTMNRCVRNMIEQVDVPMVDAIKMASLNPAKVIKEDDHLGSIVKGKDASLTIIDEMVNVYMTVVKGKIVHNAL